MRRLWSFFQRLQPVEFGLVDIGEFSIRLGLRQTRIPLARGFRLGQFLVVTGDSWGPVSEREHQSLGAIRRLNAALPSFVFGFNLDLAARVDLIANRRELHDGDIVQSRHLAILEVFAQTPIQLCLKVPVAFRVVGRLADIDSVDIDVRNSRSQSRSMRPLRRNRS